MKSKPLKVGCMSRLDYGSEDYRIGLWHLAAEVFTAEQVDFIVLVGGLAAEKPLKMELKAILKGAEKDKREGLKEAFLKAKADFLKDNLPVIRGAKIYMITSPAFDGPMGQEIAELLAASRSDILLYREGADRLELKQLEKILGIYAPKKGIWMRGDYYDTPVLRVLKDEKERATRGIGQIEVVGCFASAIYHPGASSDIKKPYLALPALSKVGETRTRENQVGVVVLQFDSSDLREVTVRTYNFKDLLSDEWLLVEPPKDCSKVQKALIDAMRQRGPLTIGLFHDLVDCGRKEIQTALDELVQKSATVTWPGIVQDKASKRYYFRMAWFSDRMRYKLPKIDKEEAFAGIACIHAGCKHTDMLRVRDALADILVARDINTLIGVGDFIEGLKHDLMMKGEICLGSKNLLNYTNQEKLAAYLIGSAMLKTLRVRAKKALGNPKLDEKKVEGLIRDLLPKFIYIAGNHCGWVEPLGFNALSMFRAELKAFLTYQISKFLGECGACLRNLTEIIQSKLIELSQNERYNTASGHALVLLHPSMSRTKTTSIRPQEMLAKAEDTGAKVVFGANFHVAELVHHWSLEYGQRVCMQLGTLKIKSGFEDSKMKTVDFGIGAMKISSSGGRIMRTEAGFFCTPSEDLEKGNMQVLKDFDEWLEINK